MDKIRVLIVDDSALIRTAINKMLSTSELIEVVGIANDGRAGLEKAKILLPDVITMDIEMPYMNGIQATKAIMEECPTNIIMVSTLTEDGANSTLSALENGAVDFITKKSVFSEVNNMRDELVAKVIEVGSNNEFKNKIKRRILLNQNVKHSIEKTGKVEIDAKIDKYTLNKHQDPRKEEQHPISNKTINHSIDSQKSNSIANFANLKFKALCIGISTGGPLSLQKLIPFLPANFPVPIFIVQHMPPFFTKSLSIRLNELSKINVKEGENGDYVEKGCAYMAPGGRQMKLLKNGKILISDDKDDKELFNPSVNVTLNSIIEVYHNQVLGVIMTGMGHDGRDSLVKLSKIGGYVLAQSVDSCVVAGMPQSVIEAGAANEIIALTDIANRICSIFKV